MLQDSITKDEIMMIANEFVQGLDPQQVADQEHVATARQLYRSGVVYNVDFDGYTLSGTVNAEGSVYSVHIPIRNVTESYCDCFAPTQCQHMLAVLLSAASSFGQVGDVLTLFKNNTKPSLPPIRTARQVLQSSAFEEMDYKSWQTYFENEYESFKKEQARLTYKQMYFLMSLFTDFYTKLERKAPRIVAIHELFKLHAALYCFQKLLEEIQEFEANKLYSYHQPVNVVRLFVDKVESTVRDLKTETIPEESKPILEETARLIHEAFFSTDAYTQERFFIYRHVWGELLRTEEQLQEEKQRIDTKINPLSKALASSHLLFLNGEDVSAMELLEKQPSSVVSLYFYWLEELLSAMEWDRGKDWLSFTYKQVKETITEQENTVFIQDIVRLFVMMYETYATHTNEQAGLEMILQELLPYSFTNYEQYVLAKKQYHAWTELQLLYGFEVIELLKEPLKDIEKEAPEAALPLYHHAAMEAIEERNRKSYKRAVRYLKKLRMLYKRLKRTDEWDAFIIHIANLHSRLRALQEELRRGKLIDDHTN
ncbi:MULTISPECIES: SWIM zinc finger domain-containing protein [unclassified Bacillus (in: firmicutes)]|uniref:SWIM zinc finger family protein n=1 Tax=unclassified Bacillus (in: firmicutes) TaxID=185979 RepID=UPI00383385C8